MWCLFPFSFSFRVSYCFYALPPLSWSLLSLSTSCRLFPDLARMPQPVCQNYEFPPVTDSLHAHSCSGVQLRCGRLPTYDRKLPCQPGIVTPGCHGNLQSYLGAIPRNIIKHTRASVCWLLGHSSSICPAYHMS